MKDTRPSIEARLRRMLMERPGDQRLRMGCSMFDDVKAIAAAGIRSYDPGADEGEIRRRIFLQFYGKDFTLERLQRILRSLASNTRPQRPLAGP